MRNVAEERAAFINAMLDDVTRHHVPDQVSWIRELMAEEVNREEEELVLTERALQDQVERDTAVIDEYDLEMERAG